MAMSVSKALPGLPKFEPLDGTNYKRWSQKLLIFFEQLDVDYVLFTTPPKPDVYTETSSVALSLVMYEATGNVKVKYDKDNKTVRGHLLNHMNNILFYLFVNQKSAKKIWNTFETRLQPKWKKFQKGGQQKTLKGNNDTGASKHFYSNRELFQDFQEARDGECVFMGNFTTAGVMGKGKIFLKLTSGKTLALIDVLHVPSLRRNLISGSLLNKVGLKIELEADKVIITKNGDFVGNGSICESRYVEFIKLEFPLIDTHNSHKVSNPSKTPMIPNKTELRRISTFFVDEDPKTYIEAVTSVDSSFWKEAMKNELDSIMENHTWDIVNLPTVLLNGHLQKEIYMEQPEGFAFPGQEDKVLINETKRFLSSQFEMKDLGEADVILEGFCDANWVADNDEVSSTSGYVFTLGGGAISWKFVKQTCIARSTMEFEFIALELASQEAEWLRNLVGDMPM
ncbi:Retrovirus-related Pol polyprotein from transposon TNT 1-94 [Sesamum angolense]|uniref:Retrovirus-related Pol polyprotein from transposon TNT 1-94 n=1 Tax=Sesamum angolense TaxID=2727404 RepID=A0AAE1WM13_9LAMI|nr:Retrovirus-related Pol polyprotein from transposon TNT 1-94 [Sesamum angolense]